MITHCFHSIVEALNGPRGLKPRWYTYSVAGVLTFVCTPFLALAWALWQVVRLGSG